ncbi:MAG: HD domain-containing protein, partial [Nannocystaceae bacterium]
DRIDEGAAMAALAAALLHDIGHGPLSHTFETVLPGALPHETWTSRIILDPDTEVHRVLTAIDPTLPREVERLVHGEHPIRHLARAVSGTFDVDRCDYLLRDSYMTGVRYGLLDVDWLLASLRLHLPQGAGASTLAVDGNKGLTAVEGFFLARLYMYRQVYLHKAVRGAEVVVRALFHRLVELGPQPGTPDAFATLLRGDPLTVHGYLRLDDRTLDAAIDAYTDNADPLLRSLALRIRDRRLFKTMQLRADADLELAQARLHHVLHETGAGPSYLGVIDRNEIRAYDEDHALGVVGHSHGQYRSLLDASPVLRGLSRERFVHNRAVFPPSVRAA